MPIKKLFKEKYILKYTLLFAFCFFVCWEIYLLSYGKTYFRYTDGFDQHYISFVFIGKYVRDIISSFFHGNFSIPNWGSYLGYGADIFTTLAAYICDPFTYISVLFPQKASEFAYCIMIILKFYCAGLAYSLFAFHRNYKPFNVLCGAISYVFAGVSYVGFYQSFFINPLYIFPILLIGVDLIFQNKKPLLYTLTLAFSFINYFYFAYMMCILVFLYCLLTVIFNKQYWDKKFVVNTILRFLIFSLIAAGISMFSLFPIILSILNAKRLSINHYLPVLFDKAYYASVISGFACNTNLLGRDCNIGFGASGIIFLSSLFVAKNKNWKLITELILMILGLFIPYAGHIMNGFSYTSSRWSFALSLLVSYSITIMIDEIKKMNITQISYLSILSFIYIFVNFSVFKTTTTKFIAPSLMIIIFSIIAHTFNNISTTTYKFFILLFIVSSMSVMSFFTFSKDYDNSFNNYVDRGTALDTAMNTGGLSLLNDIDIKDNERFDRYGIGKVRNSDVLYQKSGLSFYYSMYNDDVDQFHNSLALNLSGLNYSYNGMDRRSEVVSLLGIQHYFVNSSDPLPYGFDTLEAEKEILINKNSGKLIYQKAYKSRFMNSIFYTFENSIPYSEFANLNPVEKQHILTKAIVVDDDLANTKIKDYDISNDKVEHTIEQLSGKVNCNKNSFIVEKANSEIIIKLADEYCDGDIYVYFNNLQFQKDKKTKYTISIDGRYNEEKIPSANGSFTNYTSYSHLYGGKNNWVVSLGNVKKTINNIVIKFSEAGEYKFDSVDVMVVDNKTIEDNISNLHNNGIIVKESVDKYEVDLSVDKKCYLFSSIPYNKGWSIYDNGQKINTIKSDIAFMSINLEPGHHHIEYKYQNNNLLYGTVISIVSILLYMVVAKYDDKKNII